MLAYLLNLAVLLGIAVILAWSLNVLIGYAGIFSVMHAAFYGVGAYVAAQFALHVSSDFLLATLVAMAVTGTLAFLVAVPVLRVREEYFVVAAIGFQMVASTLFITWEGATGGMGGLTGIPPATLFGYQLISPFAYLALTLACTLGCALVLLALVHSPFGRALKTLRDDETAAVALGKHPVMLRLIATTIGGAMAAIGGSLYAFYVSFVNPESFTLDYSILLMTMVIIGGAGTLLGPVLGAVFITVFPALLNFLQVPSNVLGPVQQIVYGMMIVLLMLFMPEGLVSVGKIVRARTRAPKHRRGDEQTALPGRSA
jgi:branched-chain amino acid transport system permease protein